MTKLAPPRLEILGVRGIPEVRRGDDLAALALEALSENGLALAGGDVLVFTQKIVSKSEGRLVALAEIEPSALASRFARTWDRDARIVEIALREARRVVRMDRGVLVTETAHGFVCANSGVDASNVAEDQTVCLLPEDPDRSAEGIRRELEERTGRRLAVVISDTFGRPWRQGQTNVAVGVAGMDPLRDHRGLTDPRGRTLAVTVIAVADEMAAAAELVMGKLDRVPLAIVRGYPWHAGSGGTPRLIRPAEKDLFR